MSSSFSIITSLFSCNNVDVHAHSYTLSLLLLVGTTLHAVYKSFLYSPFSFSFLIYILYIYFHIFLHDLFYLQYVSYFEFCTISIHCWSNLISLEKRKASLMSWFVLTRKAASALVHTMISDFNLLDFAKSHFFICWWLAFPLEFCLISSLPILNISFIYIRIF